jgi:molybdate transport system substrate-binding protein
VRRTLALLALLALAVPAATSAGGGITVFAAASLASVFPRIDAAPRYSFAGSDSLALQIRGGAPADVYASASPTQPQSLFKDGLVSKPQTFATNTLVVVVPRSNPARIRSVYDLRRRGVKLVVGDATVPIGVYTRQVLRRLAIAHAVFGNVVSQQTDVKGIVAAVALGQADAGFVYTTDARAVRSRVKAVPIPARAQPSVRYQIAVVAASANQAAASAFMREVLSQRGRTQLVAAGFGLPPRRP